MNIFLEKLRRGETVFGQMILDLFSPGIGPMLSVAGMEFVIYDMEHCRCDIGLLSQMIASCRGSQIVPMVRVPDFGAAPLSRVLDLGARGVMVPRIETRSQAEEVVAQLKYSPLGRRGVALGIAHDLYRPGNAAFFEEANKSTAVILLLETAKAYDNLEDILSVPGIDVAWMGHYDLTVSMGIPAQFDHPKFLDAMDRLVNVTKQRGIAAGFLPSTPESAVHWIRRGFRAISLGSDTRVYIQAVKTFREQVIGEIEKDTRLKGAKPE
jgi:2-dehydro-3-deoxyglucarate aldolase/4-hydroxy-2-oxoheptanedioate aldolase